jgi:hypothetical protein
MDWELHHDVHSCRTKSTQRWTSFSIFLLNILAEYWNLCVSHLTVNTNNWPHVDPWWCASVDGCIADMYVPSPNLNPAVLSPNSLPWLYHTRYLRGNVSLGSKSGDECKLACVNKNKDKYHPDSNRRRKEYSSGIHETSKCFSENLHSSIILILFSLSCTQPLKRWRTKNS